MSEEEAVPMETEEVEAAAPAVPEPPKALSKSDALQEVLKTALVNDGLARGLHECAREIEKGNAQLCIIAKNCDEKDYVKFINAFTKMHNVQSVTVDDRKVLGEWAGLCKIDREGAARKIVGCSCVVITDYGEEGEAYHALMNHLSAADAE